MKIQGVIKNVKRILDSNSPVILTGLAVSGACLTAYLAAKGGMKAAPALNEARTAKADVNLTKGEKFLLTYKFYAPAAVSLFATSACMVMATKIGLDRTAAVAGAFVIAERTNDQYRDKVKELLGETKDTKVEDAVAADDVKNMVVPPTMILAGTDQIFLDRWSMRAFPCTMEKLMKSVNEINHELIYGSYASLTEFYKLIGLSETEESDDIGWTKHRLLELKTTPIMHEGQAVVAFSFDNKPMPGFQTRGASDFDHCP